MDILKGVRVVDFGQLTAGANTSAMLADLGAEVIKIESHSYMDLFRHVGPRTAADWWNRSPPFQFTNRNKQGVALDLKQPEGRRLAGELIARSDIVVENYRRDVLDGLGLGYARMRALNPAIVYASISSQGETGPYRMHRSFGSTLEAMGGLSAITGYGDTGPRVTGGDVNYPDQVVSLIAAGFILAALRQARRSGLGAHLDISQREVVAFLLGEQIMAAAADPARTDPGPQGNAEEGLLLQDCFVGADGRWIAISIADAPAAERARAIVGAGPDEDLHAAITRWRLARPGADAVAQLIDGGVQAAPVNDGMDLLGNPDLTGCTLARDAAGGLVKGMPYRFGEAAMTIARAAPDLGQHTEAVLSRMLGLDGAELAHLAALGVTAADPTRKEFA